VTQDTDVRRTLPVILIVNLLMCFSLQQAVAQQLQSAAGLTPSPDKRTGSKLNISITVFDPGIPADPSTHRRLQVFPRIRKIEALYLPFVLRETLVGTNDWGAVRVVPEPDIAAELLVSGVIVRSDGETLELQLRAIDASGRVWLDQDYAGVATISSGRSDAEPGDSGYQNLYDEISEDLRIARDLLDDKMLDDVVELSFLRYANQLAPSAFGDYLSSEADGTFKIHRLPAENDPMLERIERIRGVEYVFTDTVDKKFRELNAEIASTYDLWRKYRREFNQYQKEEAERLQYDKSDAPRGSYEAIKKRYDNYKWARIAEQEQESWAEGFNNEVGPTVMAMESRVAELEGWVKQQYAEWGRLLAEIFSLETRLTE